MQFVTYDNCSILTGEQTVHSAQQYELFCMLE